MSENKKWDCNCQEYLKAELKNLKPFQTDAKKVIEELLTSKECPYKILDIKSRENYSNFKSHWCSSTTIDPMENLSHIPNQNFMADAGIYTRCECGEDVRLNLQWIDKSSEYSAEDDGWEEHIKNCHLHLDKNQNTQSVDTNSKTNYLPWILGGNRFSFFNRCFGLIFN